MAPIIVDDEVQLKLLLHRFKEHTTEERLVFVDIEGVDLGRHGTISIMQLLMPPEPVVYLVDVHTLGSKAFDLTCESGTSLKSILESNSVYKVFFDVRSDSDALFAHFGINLAGVIDLQLLEYATRARRGGFVNGLTRCIEKDLPYVPGWSIAKTNGRRLFEPSEGGKYEIFLERPIPAGIITYCENDVLLMPQLLARYGPNLRTGIAAQIQDIVDDRIRQSKAVNFSGKGRHMAIGPAIYWTSALARGHVSPEIALVTSSRLPDLCRLDESAVASLSSQLNKVQIEHKPSGTSSSVPSCSTNTVEEEAASAADTNTSCESPPLTSNLLFDEEAERSSRLNESLYESFGYGGEWYHTYDRDSDNDFQPDFTACSADDCGYCGNCDY